jgi:hypothetical protein
MTFLDTIHNVIIAVESRAKQTSYPEDDLRKTFFLKIVDCLNSFYYGNVAVEMAALTRAGKLRMPSDSTPEDLKHPNLFISLSEPRWIGSFKSSLNRHLLVDTWTTFEICVTGIIHHLLSLYHLVSMQLYQYNDVVRVLRKNSTPVDETVLEKLRKTLIQSHVPIGRKIDAIFKNTGNSYARDAKKDKEFLAFYGKLRNSMHNNFVYSGKDYEYEWRGVKFQFRNNKFLWFSCPEGEFPLLVLFLVDELTVVYEAIAQAIQYSQTIVDPVTCDLFQIR